MNDPVPLYAIILIWFIWFAGIMMIINWRKIKHMLKSKNSFSRALEALKSGATIYRAVERPIKYCKCTTIIEGKETYHLHELTNYKRYAISFSDTDVMAEDWIIEEKS